MLYMNTVMVFKEWMMYLIICGALIIANYQSIREGVLYIMHSINKKRGSSS
jgi:hypothetical protein